MIRLGAAAGAHVQPAIWRSAQAPLLAVLRRGDTPRPRLEQEVRAQLVTHYAGDNTLLSRLLARDFSDWLAIEGRGTYTVRRS